MTATRPTAITSMSDYDEPYNILIHAEPGVGKTVLAGSAPNALILTTETGLVSAQRFGSDAEIWRIRAWDEDPENLDLVSAYTWLAENPDHGFDWVVLDSLTRMQFLAMQGVVAKARALKPGRDPDVPELQDYLKVQLMMKRATADFCELPVNVLFTALSLETETDEGDPLLIPYLEGGKGKISAFICGEMQAVGHLALRTSSSGEQFRRLYLQPAAGFYAKDRYGAPKGYVDRPTMPKLIAAFERGANTEN